MAETIQSGVRYVLVVLGMITVVLAAWMARENLWWMAVPDALFGVGVGWMALASGNAERHPFAVAPAEALPPPAPQPPAPEPVAVTTRAEPHPAAVSAPAPSPASSRTVRSGKKKRRH
ncbi:MAG: hypothetical protein ACRD1C_01715 [Terriglobales bacterium]